MCVEGERDREWMGWIGRFRFVTTGLLAERFGVSERQARARVARLESTGLVVRSSNPTGVYLSGRALRQFGFASRRVPRLDAQREHELAIVAQVIAYEHTAPTGTTVLTERELRRREADDGERFHLAVRNSDAGTSRGERWPDIVVIDPAGTRTAIELEFTPKHTPRLARIVQAYLASDYDRVFYVVRTVPVARRVLQLAGERTLDTRGFPQPLAEQLDDDARTEVHVLAWHGTDPLTAQRIRQTVAQRPLPGAT